MNKKDEKSDWSVYDEEEDQPLLVNDYEHKAYLINPRIRKVKSAKDLLIKELSLSFIDNELALIYANKITCAEEWANLGFHQISERRMVHLAMRLSLMKSVDGFERVLQTANTNADIEFARKGVKIKKAEEKNPLSGLLDFATKREGEKE